MNHHPLIICSDFKNISNIIKLLNSSSGNILETTDYNLVYSKINYKNFVENYDALKSSLWWSISLRCGQDHMLNVKQRSVDFCSYDFSILCFTEIIDRSSSSIVSLYPYVTQLERHKRTIIFIDIENQNLNTLIPMLKPAHTFIYYDELENSDSSTDVLLGSLFSDYPLLKSDVSLVVPNIKTKLNLQCRYGSIEDFYIVPNYSVESWDQTQYEYIQTGKIVAIARNGEEIVFAKTIKAFREIQRFVPTIQFEIYIDDANQPLLQSLINSMELISVIQLKEFDKSIDNFSHELEYAQLLITTNVNSCYDTCVLSLAKGCSVLVVTDSKFSLPTVVTHGYNGYVIDEDNTKKIVKTITTVLSDKKLAQQLSNNAYASTRPYDKALVAEKWHDLLDKVIKREDRSIKSYLLSKPNSSAQLLDILLTHSKTITTLWQKNHTGNSLFESMLLVSISDGVTRAKVLTLHIDRRSFEHDNLNQIFQRVVEGVQTDISYFENEIKWVRLEWISGSRSNTWLAFKKELEQEYKRNYFRNGIALQGTNGDWLPVSEMELNANACLYLGGDVQHASVNQTNLLDHMEKKFGKNNLPLFDDDMPIWLFNTVGVFIDIEENTCHKLANKRREWGKREVKPLNEKNVSDYILKGSKFLARQIQDTGQYIYGYFPCFDKRIDTYNVLRHASSTYSLLESYEFAEQQERVDEDFLKYLKQQIVNSLIYIQNEHVQSFGDDKAYLIDVNSEIKLGANATCILAIVKFTRIFNNDVFVPLANQLACGIESMQQDNGRFNHVLCAEDLKVKDPYRIIFYEGEATFALVRLYGLTHNIRWLDSAARALDYYIVTYDKAHDHWMSYTVNEIVKFRPEKRYFAFGVNNITGYMDYIENRLTTFPTLLELSTAFHNMLLTLQHFPQYYDVLDGFDLIGFYNALHTRANYLLNGFFFPEIAMFYKAPNKIVNSFFIRHHAFRVRIDDVEHYLSGLIAYQKLLVQTSFKSQLNISEFGYKPSKEKTLTYNSVLNITNNILNSISLPIVTNGIWLQRPNSDWFATGICISPNSFLKNKILVARGEKEEKGYLTIDSINKFIDDGASAVIADYPIQLLNIDIPVLVVNDIKQALIDIANWCRQCFSNEVIGVTGSAGKTTTVAMLEHTLSLKNRVSKTLSNANLPIGVAWNIASMSQNSNYWVVEMAVGQMSLNSKLVQPNVAIITNIGPAHLKYHHSMENIADKKSKIFESMNPGDLAIIYHDMKYYERIKTHAKSRGLIVMSYGEHQNANIRLERVLNAKAIINIKGKSHELMLEAQGKHMIMNAMATLCVTSYYNLSTKAAIEQLKSFLPISGRGDICDIIINKQKVTLYDEAYNANPLSMKAALDTFDDVSVLPLRKVVILGEMLELGINSENYHLDLKEQIKKIHCREIVLVGDMYESLVEILRAQHIRTSYFKNVKELELGIPNIVQEGDNILIKASHSVGLKSLFNKYENYLKADRI